MENHLTRSSRDAWRGAGLAEKRSHHDHKRRVDGQVLGYKRQTRLEVRVIQPRDQSWNVKPPNPLRCHRDANDVECLVRKKKLEEAKAQAPDMQATQPPTSELVIALKALPRAEDPPPQTVNELMEGTLRDYEEVCVEEGAVPSQLTTEEGDSEDQDLNQMEANLNDLLYEACPFHPHQFIHCVNPQTEFGQLRCKCPQEGCPMYLFEDTCDIMLDQLKEDTHPQVRAQLQRGLLKCQCGFTPKMKLSRTTKNYNSVFELWELSHPCKTLWLFSMAPWPTVASPRASATVPETMGQ